MSQSPLTILHVLDHSRPVDDGYAFRSHAILQAQRARGWHAEALTSPKHFESWRGLRLDVESVDSQLYHRARHVGRSRWPLISECRVMHGTASRAQQLIDRVSPHILHAHSPVLNVLPAIWLGRRHSLPVVYELRASWEDAAVSTGRYSASSWQYRVSRGLETSACRWADHVVVICDGLKDELIARGIQPSKITVIPNGVNPDDFTPRGRDLSLSARLGLDGLRTVGFIGSFFTWEGLELLVEAMSHLATVRNDIRLLLVGDGDTKQALQEQVSRLGLQQQVIMPGRVSPAEVAGLYSVVDVLAYPRHSARLTELVTPLKPLEAMAMGKAVVASDVGGHRELIRHMATGLLFRAGDPRALASAIVRVLDDDVLRQNLEGEGRRWVTQERNWHATTKGYDGVYRRVLGEDATVASDPTTTGT